MFFRNGINTGINALFAFLFCRRYRWLADCKAGCMVTPAKSWYNNLDLIPHYMRAAGRQKASIHTF